LNEAAAAVSAVGKKAQAPPMVILNFPFFHTDPTPFELLNRVLNVDDISPKLRSRFNHIFKGIEAFAITILN
jgi:hypothetical protein